MAPKKKDSRTKQTGECRECGKEKKLQEFTLNQRDLKDFSGRTCQACLTRLKRGSETDDRDAGPSGQFS